MKKALKIILICILCLGFLGGGVFAYLKFRKVPPCEVYPAPFAVNLDANDQTWVEPDVSVIWDPGLLSDRGCEGAPDLVIEVVSPSSRRMDYIMKPLHYVQAGVRECWVVDPQAGHTTVYLFSEDGPQVTQYPFEAPLPVGIWDGIPQITLAELL